MPLALSSLNYPKPSAAVRRRFGRVWRGDRKGRVQQLADRPSVIGEAKGFPWRTADGLMPAA